MGLVYIVALHQLESKKIYSNLAALSTKENPLDFEFLRPQQLADRLEEGIDLIVYSNPHVLNLEMKQAVSSWRKKGALAPILLLSRVNSQQDIDEMETLSNFVLLEKPYVDKDLVGIACKLLLTAQVAQRKFRRFPTNQKVQITSYSNAELKAQTKVHNISLGGVCVEGDCEQLQVGDLLYMNFNLDRLNTERTMCGRVVWVQGAGKSDQQASAGVQFVKDKELYGHLIKTIA